MRPNNAINTDTKRRGAFVAPLSTAGYGERLDDLLVGELYAEPLAERFGVLLEGREANILGMVFYS